MVLRRRRDGNEERKRKLKMEKNLEPNDKESKKRNENLVKQLSNAL